MEAIITAAIGAAVKLVELIFLGTKSKDLSQDEIDREIKRIADKEQSLVDKWWNIVK